MKMTLFEEQASSRTERTKQSQRGTSVWDNGFTVRHTNTRAQAHAHLHERYVSVHKCTLNISGGSVQSLLLEPQADRA